MFPRLRSSFSDKFTGYTYNTNLWFTSVTGSGAVGTVSSGSDAYGGQMRVTCSAGSAGTALLYSVSLEFWTAYWPVYESLFRLQQTSDIVARHGFYIDGNNYVAIEADDSNSGNFIFVANKAGSRTEVDTGVSLTTANKNVEIHLRGFGGDAKCLFGDDKSNILTIANANLPTGTGYCLFAYTSSPGGGSGNSRLFLIDAAAHEQATQ